MPRFARNEGNWQIGIHASIAALIGASFYILHTANAETVNYISAMSDLLSTTLMVMSLVIYGQKPRLRKFGFYLLPALLALFTKEVSTVFPLLLLLYIFYEQKITWRRLLDIIPASLMCLSAFVLYNKMIPQTFFPSSHTRLEYMLAQPFVILHYFTSFFLPFNLSADTDWTTIKNPFDDRVVVGLIFIALLLAFAIKFWRKDQTRPIAFGIWWFFIGVLPPSSGVVILNEVMNDHRMFLPFIGLAIAVSWGATLLLIRLFAHDSRFIKTGVIITLAVIINAHAYGTFQRNKVWLNEESLWYDVTQKSPKNDRGLMNYGAARMAKGKVKEALFYFERALRNSPDYAFLHINIAVAHNALGDNIKAESHFKKAIKYNNNYYGGYFFYARFLNDQGRQNEAVPHLIKAVELAPGYIKPRYLLMRIMVKLHDWDGLRHLVEDTLNHSPNDEVAKAFYQLVFNAEDRLRVLAFSARYDPSFDNYITLSQAYFYEGHFEKAIKAAQMALTFNKDSKEAHNTKCSAFLKLRKKSQALEACEKALFVDPHCELSKNNLMAARNME